jgi:hypothetical protein
VGAGGALSTSAWALISARFSDTANTWSIRLDGASYASGSTSASLTASRTTYFSRGQGGELPYGDYAEVISYDAYLSDSDVAAVEDYLDAKWLTESTPATVTASAVAGTAAVNTSGWATRDSLIVMGGASKTGRWT